MSDNTAADLGAKALGLPKFPKFRETINGYALVKAAYPDLNLPDYVYEISDDDETIPKRGSKLQRVQAMIMKFEVVSLEFISEYTPITRSYQRCLKRLSPFLESCVSFSLHHV